MYNNTGTIDGEAKDFSCINSKEKFKFVVSDIRLRNILYVELSGRNRQSPPEEGRIYTRETNPASK